jgi:hypothetical protein
MVSAARGWIGLQKGKLIAFLIFTCIYLKKKSSEPALQTNFNQTNLVQIIPG